MARSKAALRSARRTRAFSRSRPLAISATACAFHVCMPTQLRRRAHPGGANVFVAAVPRVIALDRVFVVWHFNSSLSHINRTITLIGRALAGACIATKSRRLVMRPSSVSLVSIHCACRGSWWCKVVCDCGLKQIKRAPRVCVRSARLALKCCVIDWFARCAR